MEITHALPGRPAEMAQALAIAERGRSHAAPERPCGEQRHGSQTGGRHRPVFIEEVFPADNRNRMDQYHRYALHLPSFRNPRAERHVQLQLVIAWISWHNTPKMLTGGRAVYCGGTDIKSILARRGQVCVHQDRDRGGLQSRHALLQQLIPEKIIEASSGREPAVLGGAGVHSVRAQEEQLTG